MSLFRLQFLALLLSLSCCAVRTAPVPQAFSLSSESIRQRYPATRTMGTVELFGKNIAATPDDNGRDAYLASGGALLIKKSTPPIHAQAPSILVTPDFAEVRGKGTVKRGDRLFIGKADSTRFIIDGVVIKPNGPHEIRAVANRPPASVLDEAAHPAPTETKRNTTVSSQAIRKPASESSSKPKAKPTSSASKPAGDSSSTQSKEVSPEDRARLLDLLRAPKAE